MYKTYRIFLFSLLIFTSASIFAQVETDTIVPKKNFIQKVWGDNLLDGITFMPYGYHMDRVRHAGEVFHDVWYVAGSYKSFELTYFKNSFGDPTVGIFYSRAINFTKRFSLVYGGGLIYGYHGRLEHVEGIPFRKTFLVTGEINPVPGLALNYKFAKKWSINMSFAPQIIVYGVRYTFKDGY